MRGSILLLSFLSIFAGARVREGRARPHCRARRRRADEDAGHRRPQRPAVDAARTLRRRPVEDRPRVRHRQARAARGRAGDDDRHPAPARRACRRAVLVGLDSGRDDGPGGRADDASSRSISSRRSPRASRAISRWPIRPPTSARAEHEGQDRLADRRRRRPPDQRFARGAARVLRSRRALHDADAFDATPRGPIRRPTRPSTTA